MEKKYKDLLAKSIELGALEAKLMDTEKIIFDPRSHLKCRFGCNRWGRFWTCPPHLNLSQEMFMDAFGVDIGKTLEPLGFKVEFDKEGKLFPAWYSMVLLD